jgi:hypothetical protein
VELRLIVPERSGHATSVGEQEARAQTGVGRRVTSGWSGALLAMLDRLVCNKRLTFPTLWVLAAVAATVNLPTQWVANGPSGSGL